MLNASQIAQRENKLTASRVACLMTGDTDKILNLWRELVGDPEFVPEDLSGVWPVQLGSATEALNIAWYCRKYGSVSGKGDVIVGSPEWMAATLDGWDDARKCPIEAKHVGGREPLETIIARYQPQMHWQMMVTKSTECALSVIMGANEPIVEFIGFDKVYGDELMKRATQFWQCVENMTPPFALAPAAVPVIADKIYTMATPEWITNAQRWLQTCGAVETAKDAEKKLKALVPEDAKKAVGSGVQISRDRAGRLSLRQRED
jgi:hypothetical protein